MSPSSIELRNFKDDHKTSSAATTTTSSTYSGNSCTAKHRVAFVLVLILCITAVTMTRFPEIMDHYSHTQGKIVAKTDDFATIPLQPKKEYLYGGHHYYLLPKSPYKKAIGVLIVIHECQRSGLDFFHLPEDRIVAKDALDRGLAVLSLTSKDRDSGCFSVADASDVGKIVNQWTLLHGLQDLPRYGLGVSSGASFLFFVYRAMKLDSMAVYNTPQGYLPDDIDDNAMVPTAFVTMPLDKSVSKRMRDSRKELSVSKIPTLMLKVSPRPFAKSMCTARLPEMLPNDCERIFELLHSDFSHLLDKDGFVVEDVARSEDWKKLTDALHLDSWSDVLHYQTPKTSAGHSWPYAAVEQEFRTCHARHGMSSEHHSAVLEFLTTAPAQITPSDGRRK